MNFARRSAFPGFALVVGVSCLVLSVLLVLERPALSTQQTKSLSRSTIFNTRDGVTLSAGSGTSYLTEFTERNGFYSGSTWPAADGIITDIIVGLSRPLSGSERITVDIIQGVSAQGVAGITFGPGEDSIKALSPTTGWPFDDAYGWNVVLGYNNLGSSVTVYVMFHGFDQSS